MKWSTKAEADLEQERKCFETVIPVVQEVFPYCRVERSSYDDDLKGSDLDITFPNGITKRLQIKSRLTKAGEEIYKINIEIAGLNKSNKLHTGWGLDDNITDMYMFCHFPEAKFHYINIGTDPNGEHYKVIDDFGQVRWFMVTKKALHEFIRRQGFNWDILMFIARDMFYNFENTLTDTKVYRNKDGGTMTLTFKDRLHEQKYITLFNKRYRNNVSINYYFDLGERPINFVINRYQLEEISVLKNLGNEQLGGFVYG